MTREDIYLALTKWAENKPYRGQPDQVIDFALEMVQRHNEELQYLAGDYMDAEELIDRMERAKP